MKIIPKIIVLISLFCLDWFKVNGQDTKNLGRLKLGLQANLGITTANSPFGYGLGIGLTLGAPLSEELSLGMSTGYNRLLTKDTSPVKDYDFIPLKAWVKIFPTPTSFYVMGLAGTGFGIQPGSKPSFIFGGGLGYQWNNIYDLALKFEGYQQSKNSSTYRPFNGQYAVEFNYQF